MEPVARVTLEGPNPWGIITWKHELLVVPFGGEWAMAAVIRRRFTQCAFYWLPSLVFFVPNPQPRNGATIDKTESMSRTAVIGLVNTATTS